MITANTTRETERIDHLTVGISGISIKCCPGFEVKEIMEKLVEALE